MRLNGQRVVHEEVDFWLYVHENVEQATYSSIFFILDLMSRNK